MALPEYEQQYRDAHAETRALDLAGSEGEHVAVDELTVLAARRRNNRRNREFYGTDNHPLPADMARELYDEIDLLWGRLHAARLDAERARDDADLLAKVVRGVEDLAAGRIIPLDEVRRRIAGDES